jgi:hypothetical protein
MKTKDFDCVEMKRLGAEVLYDKLKAMTPEDQLAFWEKSTEKLRNLQRAGKCDRKGLSSLPLGSDH